LTGSLKFEASTLPKKPDGSSFAAFVQPFTAAVDACKNQGLIVDDSNSFLARVDLAILQSNPAKIATPLPPGTCTAGFTVSCSNGNGVTYFPLPILRPTKSAGVRFAHKRYRPRP
jgi:hypothetical protein